MYEGDWKDGNAHGQGKMAFTDGNVSKGEWKNGELIIR